MEPGSNSWSSNRSRSPAVPLTPDLSQPHPQVGSPEYRLSLDSNAAQVVVPAADAGSGRRCIDASPRPRDKIRGRDKALLQRVLSAQAHTQSQPFITEVQPSALENRRRSRSTSHRNLHGMLFPMVSASLADADRTRAQRFRRGCRNIRDLFES